MIGLAVAGSWLTDEIDEFSDLDLVMSPEKYYWGHVVGENYAKRLGNFLSGFTGEHMAEPRLLICLYADYLLHVDLKFLTLAEFSSACGNSRNPIGQGRPTNCRY